MFSSFTNTLTSLSNDYIDWSRTADLFRSASHRYTTEQIAVRGAMIFTTALSGFLGAYYNDQEKTNVSNITASIVMGTLGLIVSHVYVVAPLVYKRYKVGQDCHRLINEIKDKVDSDILDEVLNTIMSKSMATQTRSNSSQTWGRRKTLLTNLNNALEAQDSNLLNAIADNDLVSIMSIIENSTISQTLRLK